MNLSLALFYLKSLVSMWLTKIVVYILLTSVTVNDALMKMPMQSIDIRK